MDGPSTRCNPDTLAARKQAEKGLAPKPALSEAEPDAKIAEVSGIFHSPLSVFRLPCFLGVLAILRETRSYGFSVSEVAGDGHDGSPVRPEGHRRGPRCSLLRATDSKSFWDKG